MSEIDGFETVKDIPTGDFRQKHLEAIRKFGDSMAGYIATHPDYDHWTKDDAVRQVISVMASDIGAANRFLQLIGVKIDLYTYDFEEEKKDGSESDHNHGEESSDAGGEIRRIKG